MADKKIKLIWESPTHWNISLPVDGHEFIVSVDKMDFTISLSIFEYMEVESIVKLIVQLYMENKDNPVILDFLRFLQRPENNEELRNLQYIYRNFHP